MKKEYELERDQWFPSKSEKFCNRIVIRGVNRLITKSEYDKRTAGLFKIEWQGLAMIALASKMYFGVGLAKLNFIEYKNLKESINLNEFREIDGVKICDKKFDDLIENKYKLYSSDKGKDIKKLR